MRAALALLLPLCHGCTLMVWSSDFSGPTKEPAHPKRIEQALVTTDGALALRIAFREIDPRVYRLPLMQIGGWDPQTIVVAEMPTDSSAREAHVVDKTALAMPIDAKATGDALLVALDREAHTSGLLLVFDPRHPETIMRARLEEQTWEHSHVLEAILITPIAVVADILLVPIAIIVILPLKLCGVHIGH